MAEYPGFLLYIDDWGLLYFRIFYFSDYYSGYSKSTYYDSLRISETLRRLLSEDGS